MINFQIEVLQGPSVSFLWWTQQDFDPDFTQIEWRTGIWRNIKNFSLIQDCLLAYMCSIYIHIGFLCVHITIEPDSDLEWDTLKIPCPQPLFLSHSFLPLLCVLTKCWENKLTNVSRIEKNKLCHHTHSLKRCTMDYFPPGVFFKKKIPRHGCVSKDWASKSLIRSNYKHHFSLSQLEVKHVQWFAWEVFSVFTKYL